MAVEDKLSTVRFSIDTEAHIKVNTELCVDCVHRPCLYVCPVQNYELRETKVVFSWQGCMECGACRIVCPHGAVDWKFPRGGFGVCLRYG